MGNTQEILEIQNNQKKIKKEKKKLIKSIPYFIFGFVFFGIGVIYLLEEKLNHIVGNSHNLILIIAIIFGIVSLIYMIIISLKVKNKNEELKLLGNKLYNLMKLK